MTFEDLTAKIAQLEKDNKRLLACDEENEWRIEELEEENREYKKERNDGFMKASRLVAALRIDEYCRQGTVEVRKVYDQLKDLEEKILREMNK